MHYDEFEQREVRDKEEVGTHHIGAQRSCQDLESIMVSAIIAGMPSIAVERLMGAVDDWGWEQVVESFLQTVPLVLTPSKIDVVMAGRLTERLVATAKPEKFKSEYGFDHLSKSSSMMDILHTTEEQADQIDALVDNLLAALKPTYFMTDVELVAAVQVVMRTASDPLVKAGALTFILLSIDTKKMMKVENERGVEGGLDHEPSPDKCATCPVKDSCDKITGGRGVKPSTSYGKSDHLDPTGKIFLATSQGSNKKEWN